MMHRLRECLKLAELPEALEIVQAARKGALDSKSHSRGSHGGKGKTRQDNVYPVRVNSDTMTSDRSGRRERSTNPPQRRRGTDLQSKLD